MSSSTHSHQINIVSLSGAYFQRLNAIKSILDQQKDSQVIYFDDQYSAEYIYNEVTSLDSGIFCESNEKSIFILNSLPSFPKENNKKWSQCFTQVSQNNNIILILNNCCVDSTLNKFINKIGKVIDFEEKITISQGVFYCQEYFKENKKKISDEDIYLILERVGIIKDKINLDELHSQLLLLIQFNKEKLITKENILLCVPQEPIFDIFNYFNVLDTKDYCDIYYNFKIGLKFHDNDCLQFLCSNLPLLRWRYKLIYLYLLFKSQGLNPINELSKIKKINKEGVEVNLYNDYAVRNLKISNNLDEVQTILNLINKLLEATRKNLSNEDLEIKFQQLLLVMSGHEIELNYI